MITNDVETTSILNHKLRDKTGEYVLNQGMPRLLDLYDKYGVKATFFYTGHIAKLYPDVVKMAYNRGHEVGSHGLTHEVSKAFDVLSPEEQLSHLKQSKQILEDIVGEEVVSFRAPAARVDKKFPQIMKEAGFKVDSSVSSQRLDMMFSFGAKHFQKREVRGARSSHFCNGFSLHRHFHAHCPRPQPFYKTNAVLGDFVQRSTVCFPYPSQ